MIFDLVPSKQTIFGDLPIASWHRPGLHAWRQCEQVCIPDPEGDEIQESQRQNCNWSLSNDIKWHNWYILLFVIIIITIYHNWSHLTINFVDEASNQSHCGMTSAQRCTHVTYNVHLIVFMLHGIYYQHWLVVWNIFLFFHILGIIWNNHPNWRTPSFFRGVGQPPTRRFRFYEALMTLIFIGVGIVYHQPVYIWDTISLTKALILWPLQKVDHAAHTVAMKLQRSWRVDVIDAPIIHQS